MVDERKDTRKPELIVREGDVFTQTEQLDKLAAALAKAQKKIRPAARNAVNPHFRHKYADLGAVIEATMGPLADEGIAVVQGANVRKQTRIIMTSAAPSFAKKMPEQQAKVMMLLLGDDGVQKEEVDETIVSVTTRLVHESGQWIESQCSAVARADDPQAIGSVITYLRRYGLSAMTGCAAEDDDAESAYRRGRKQETKPKGGKRSGAKLPPEAISAIRDAFEKFNVSIELLEEKLGKKRAAWTDVERTACSALYKELEDGVAKEDLFGIGIPEPEPEKAPKSDAAS